MIDPKDILTVKHDLGGSFDDYSNDASDFIRDDFSLTLLASEYIYIGLHKPFGATYVALTTANSNSGAMTVEYYNGSGWAETSYTQDETKGLTRSGFVFWDKTAMQETTIDSKAAYYVRISIANDTSLMAFRGINLVMSDDSRMKANFPPVTNQDMYPSGENSHILTHVSARDEIIMELRKRYQKNNENLTDVWQKINVWDLIDLFELREAATYLALAKTFFNLSDNPEDHWFEKYNHWKKKYHAAFETAYLSIDTDDDGVDDDEEVQKHKVSASVYR